MIKYKISSVKSPKSGLKVYFPSIVQVAHLSFDDVVTAVEKECTLTRADVRGALSALEYVVLKELKQGNTVRLGGVGSFRLTIVSRMARTMRLKCRHATLHGFVRTLRQVGL